MTRFDQTGVTLTKHQNNAALGVNILPDAIGQRNQHELHWSLSNTLRRWTIRGCHCC